MDHLRDSLITPPAAVEVASDLVALAVDALESFPDANLNAKVKKDFEASNLARAQVLIRSIDWTAFQWFWLESGMESERHHDPSSHPESVGAKKRDYVPAAMRVEIATRDNWSCRYCGLRVVAPSALQQLHRQLPTMLPWGHPAVHEHPAYRVLRCTFDHVVPHSRGGANDSENLVTACGACNFNKGNCSIDELQLLDPRSRPVNSSDWDGLFKRLGTRSF